MVQKGLEQLYQLDTACAPSASCKSEMLCNLSFFHWQGGPLLLTLLWSFVFSPQLSYDLTNQNGNYGLTDGEKGELPSAPVTTF